MIAVLFDFEVRAGRFDDYLALATELRAELEQIDGFLSVERFAALADEHRYLSLSLWRDQDAVKRWREQARHRAAQAHGKAEIFSRYRILVTEVLRDYGA